MTTYFKNKGGKRVPMTTNEVAERQAEEKRWADEAPKLEKLLQLTLKDLPLQKLNRVVEDLADALGDDIKNKLPDDVKQNFADKKQLREELKKL